MSYWDQITSNPRFWLSAAALGSVVAIECWFALWAATATPPARLARVAIVWLAIVILVPIQAEVPALWFTMVAALTMLLVSTVRFLARERAADESRWRGWHRFSLGDLCVLTLFVGTVLAIASRQPHGGFAVLGTALIGLPIAVVISLSYFAVRGPNRWRMLIFLLAALTIFAGLGRATWRLPHFLVSPRGLSSHELRELTLHELLLGLLILLAYHVTLLGQAAWKSRGSSNMPWRYRAQRIALAVTTTLLALLLWYFQGAINWRWADEVERLQHLLIAAAPLALLAIIVAIATALAQTWHRIQSPVWRRTIRIGAVFVVAAAAMPLAWLYWQMLWLPPLLPFESDSPTNYYRLVAIARAFRDSRGPRGRSHLSTADQQLIAEASRLLEAPNYVPVAALEEEARRPVPETAIRYDDAFAISVAFQAAAQNSQNAGYRDHAVDRAIDLLRFGTMLGRGGTRGHTRMGWTVHRGAGEILQELSGQMSPQTRRKTIRALDEALQQREDWTLQASRELAWNDRTGWEARFRSVIAELAPVPAAATNWASEDGIANELSLRGLQWELAVELVRSDTGRPPLALAEIVPGILPAMPLDPYSQQPLLLLRTPKGELIPYSVGYDGIDNGGNFTTDAGTYYHQAGFDLKLPVP